MNEKNKHPAENPQPEKLTAAPGVTPFTRFKAMELIICGIAVILGLLYLYADFLSLSVLLPLYCAAFAAITVLRWLDARAAGSHGFAALLPTVCWGILTIAVIVAACAYFLQ